MSFGVGGNVHKLQNKAKCGWHILPTLMISFLSRLSSFSWKVYRQHHPKGTPTKLYLAVEREIKDEVETTLLFFYPQYCPEDLNPHESKISAVGNFEKSKFFISFEFFNGEISLCAAIKQIIITFPSHNFFSIFHVPRILFRRWARISRISLLQKKLIKPKGKVF